MLHLALVALVAAADPAPPAPAAPTPAAAAPTPAAAAVAAPAPATSEIPASKSQLPPPTKPRLLAIDLIDKGAGPEVTSAINQAVQGQAVQSHLGETVTATQIKIALDAASNQALLGCESEQCMTDIGKTVEASIILGGSVAKVGDDFLITLLAVNARDGSRIAQQQRKVPANRELYYYAAKQLASLVLTGRAVDPRVPVIVKVASKDGDATIIVDGKETATASQTTVQLDPGSHEIRVRKSGKAEWKTVISVEEATPLQVTADLVDSRISLWPIAIGAGVVSVATLAVGLGFGVAAQDSFDGSTKGFPLVPGTEKAPGDSYSGKEPVDSQTLFTLEQEVQTRADIADGFFIAASVAGVVAVGLEATDLILNATSE
ncbi:MAG TPA: PEGA domain-containing protein [Myxococcota bacterium]